MISNERRTIYHNDKQAIVDLFVGKSVKKVSGDTLLLSDGTELQIIPNISGCSCGAGDYFLEELNECENIITNAELVETDTHSATIYELFVYSGHTKINLATIQGDDGNGYYGSGFWIKCKKDDIDKLREDD